MVVVHYNTKTEAVSHFITILRAILMKMCCCPNVYKTSFCVQITRDYTFLDYILGGCQLMFTVSGVLACVSFSASPAVW